jgi:hypothetical protein
MYPHGNVEQRFPGSALNLGKRRGERGIKLQRAHILFIARL